MRGEGNLGGGRRQRGFGGIRRRGGGSGREEEYAASPFWGLGLVGLDGGGFGESSGAIWGFFGRGEEIGLEGRRLGVFFSKLV